MTISSESRLREIAAGEGMFALGVADLEDAAVREVIVSQGGEWLTSFSRAVSLAYRLQDGIVDRLPDGHRDPSTVRFYDEHVYRAVNRRLEAAGMKVAEFLGGAGHGALVIPSSLYVEENRLAGHLPHKMAANLAGLGWIGKNALLVTRKAGPRVRLITVLTDAPLRSGTIEAGESTSGRTGPGKDYCGTCERCVEVCPAGAVVGHSFAVGEDVAQRVDVAACRDYRTAGKKELGGLGCGLCVAVCPHGQA